VHFTKGDFTLAGWRQEARVCAFVPRGYDPALILASFDRSPLKLPADPGHRAAFDALAVREHAAIEADPNVWNGPGATLSYIHFDRDNRDEPRLTIRVKPSDYLRRRTTRSLFSEHLSGVERGAFLDVAQQGVEEAYCGGFGVVLS